MKQRSFTPLEPRLFICYCGPIPYDPGTRQPHTRLGPASALDGPARIDYNLPTITSAAQIAYESLGRGAIIIDTAGMAADGGYVAAHFSQPEIRRYEDGAIDRLVKVHTPDVLVLVGDKTAADDSGECHVWRKPEALSRAAMGRFLTSSEKI